MNEFILQCKGCNTILAISQNYVNDPFQTPYDAFHLGANVCQNNDIITSKETNDKGATYKELSCSKCNNVVGKTYEETVPGVANLRKLFLFRKSMTTKFRPQLNLIPGIKQIPNNDNNNNNENVNNNMHSSNSNNSNNILQKNNMNEDKKMSKKWEEEIFKLQSVILNLNERLSTLEQERS